MMVDRPKYRDGGPFAIANLCPEPSVHVVAQKECTHCPACSADFTDRPPPCKHEWQQYMVPVDGATILDKLPIITDRSPHAIILVPDGFFCVHCTERKE